MASRTRAHGTFAQGDRHRSLRDPSYSSHASEAGAAEIYRCDDHASLQSALARVRDTPWYQRHGALVQELVPPQGYDLRILVAAGRVVGAVFRIAAPGEWRTNVALGAVRRQVADPPPEASALAVAAARATGASLVGVDLLPDGRGGWIVVELNGAVEFTAEYAGVGRRLRGDRAARTRATARPLDRLASVSATGVCHGRLTQQVPGGALLHSSARGGVAQLVRAAES